MADRPITSEQITRTASLFERSQVLLLANDAGIFDLLRKPVSVEAIATDKGWDTRGTGLFLDTLVALGYVDRKADRYENTAITTRHLCCDSPEPLTAFLRHTGHCKRRWDRLEESLQSGHGIRVGHHIAGTAEFIDYVDAMEELGNLTVGEVLEAVDFSGYRSMLDLGCGAGQCTRAFLGANPVLAATLFDLQSVLDVTEARIASTQLADRCTFLSGDCVSDAMGDGYDLIWVSNLFHGLSAVESAQVFRKCFDALEPGGTLMVKDFIVDEDRQGPAFSLLFGLHMFLHTGGGNTYSVDEFEAWAGDAGFGKPALKTLGRSARLFTVMKPESA